MSQNDLIHVFVYCLLSISHPLTHDKVDFPRAEFVSVFVHCFISNTYNGADHVAGAQ